MLNCYFLYQYSNRLETDQYKTSPGDYFYLLLLNWAACALIGLFSNFMASSVLFCSTRPRHSKISLFLP